MEVSFDDKFLETKPTGSPTKSNLQASFNEGGLDKSASGGEETQPRIVNSPTGGCIPFIKDHYAPCDPGLPGGDCIRTDE